MKLLKIVLIIFISFSFALINVKAISKEDIYSLKKDVLVCDNTSNKLLDNIFKSYQRILNERDASDKDLNKIYENVKMVINILKQNKICSINSNIPNELKTILINYYDKTMDIINNMPLITTKEKSKVVMNIDTVQEQINIYEDNILNDVIVNDSKLNDVGLNKTIIILITVILGLLITFLLLSIIYHKDIFISLTYTLIILFLAFFVFRNEISLVLDYFSPKDYSGEKEIKVDDQKIISYPSYGNNFGYIEFMGSRNDIYFGDSMSILKKGIGMQSDTSFPGEEGKMILSGHNTGLFKNLSKLQKGDEVKIITLYGKFTYKVALKDNVKNTDIASLDKDYDLILYTCENNNNIYSNKRIMVYLNLTKEEFISEK